MRKAIAVADSGPLIGLARIGQLAQKIGADMIIVDTTITPFFILPKAFPYWLKPL